MKSSGRYAVPAAFMVALLAGWEWAVAAFDIPHFVLPPPSEVGSTLWALRGPLLLRHLPATLLEIAVGLGAALVLGVLVAVGMHFSSTLEKALYPLVVASQTIPIIAISPVFLLWFGYSLTQKVAVVVLISFFSITVNTFDGFRARDPELVELLRAAGASKWKIFWKVEVPAALPFFFSGLKIAAAMSVIGATIAEWLGADSGLGYLGRRAASTAQADRLFASVIILSAVGIGLFGLVALFEKKLLHWYHRSEQATEVIHTNPK